MKWVNANQTKTERKAKYAFVKALTHSSKLAYQWRDFNYSTIFRELKYFLKTISL